MAGRVIIITQTQQLSYKGHKPQLFCDIKFKNLNIWKWYGMFNTTFVEHKRKCLGCSQISESISCFFYLSKTTRKLCEEEFICTTTFKVFTLNRNVNFS